ncbi:MAG: 3-oxoacyl-ACP synthase III family protein [Bryobacteraceae bacterium]
MLHAAVKAIEYYLPERIVSSTELAAAFPEWPVEKIEGKTGISERHIAAEDECSSDMAVAASRRLFDSGVCAAKDIDYLLLCTQSPDYFLPTTACLVQDALGIPTSAGALDFNLGCSGFVYGAGLAQGLIETGQARNVLLITAETYSKFMHARDKSVRTIFGDAAAATLISAIDSTEPALGPFVVGTDGGGGKNLIVPAGGMRCPRSAETGAATEDQDGNWRSRDNLHMNGAEIFNFTLRVVPQCVGRLLEKAGRSLGQIDLFVFHQANLFMLEHLRRKLRIPQERFCVAMNQCGNTVSSTIPIALKIAAARGELRPGHLVMVVGFGVGYSWGAGLIRWQETGA